MNEYLIKLSKEKIEKSNELNYKLASIAKQLRELNEQFKKELNRLDIDSSSDELNGFPVSKERSESISESE